MVEGERELSVCWTVIDQKKDKWKVRMNYVKGGWLEKSKYEVDGERTIRHRWRVRKNIGKG